MKTVAAVLVETGRPLELARLELPSLGIGQVLVELWYSGVCGSQLLEARGHRGEDRFLPHCLGHEATGVVVEVGPGVTRVRLGDRVVVSWIKGPGLDAGGSVLGWDDRKVNAGPVTTFSQHSVISENRLTPLADDISPEEGVVLGCAAPTGIGSVVNTGEARPGQAVAVFGTGGIGACAVAGASAAGCHPVIAIDINERKLAIARELGASHTIQVGDGRSALDELRTLIPGGVDVAIEASGVPAVMAQAMEAVRPQGGVAVVVGNARAGQQLQIDPKQFNLGKQLRGTWGGDSRPERDFPRYAALLRSGRLPARRLLDRSYPLSRINDALDDLEMGAVGRPLIDVRDA